MRNSSISGFVGWDYLRMKDKVSIQNREVAADSQSKNHDSTPVDDSAGTIYAVQALRGIAAIAVLALHSILYCAEVYRQTGTSAVWLADHGHFRMFGASGVHLFFVISGFVIAIQHNKRGLPGLYQFSAKRISRIVPMYWLCTITVMVMVSRFPDFWTKEHIVRSFLFMPAAKDFFRPVHGVGWTLSFEMFFYLSFGLVVIWQGFNRLAVLVVLSAAILLNVATGYRSESLGNLIVLEFAAGILVAEIYQRPIIKKYSTVIFAAGVLGLLSSLLWFTPVYVRELPPTVIWGLPCALIVLGASSLEASGKQLMRGPIWQLCGAASYSIYLTHPLWFHNLYYWVYFTKKFQKTIEPNLLLLIMIMISTALGIAAYVLIEKHLNAAVRSALTQIAVRWSRPTARGRSFPTP
jgi:exopolysaccharide production protein ExoZ